MEKKLRSIHIMALSDTGTRIQLLLSAETDDLRQLIFDALTKLSQYSSSSEEKFLIMHIDSTSSLHVMNE